MSSSLLGLGGKGQGGGKGRVAAGGGWAGGFCTGWASIHTGLAHYAPGPGAGPCPRG